MIPRTLFDKLWDSHVVRELGHGWALLHVDRHLMHDLGGGPAFAELQQRGLAVHDPSLTFATPDHAVSTAPQRSSHTFPVGALLHDKLRDGALAAGATFFALDSGRQGIVHVTAPELGIVLPGLSVVCTDSHTCTNGALGALAFGIGSSECVHVLATQTLRQKRPACMRIRCNGQLVPGVTAKDLALHLIAQLGTAAGTGYAIEYCGSAVEALTVEARLTLCNLTVELGARFGLIAPDESVFEWLRCRPFAPDEQNFDETLDQWRNLRSDPDARFDREEEIDASQVRPMISWGTSPQDAVAIDDRIPQDADAGALEYMDLRPGAPIAGIAVDWVFIGSCANSRLSDLRDAAAVARGRRVAQGVQAWVVPGSEAVRRMAEQEGLDEVFRAAGFEWRQPGCSLCAASNGERVPPLARCISTSNRNFVGRQGPGARTHLASPAMAAAAAVTGRIIDFRSLGATVEPDRQS